MGQEIQRQREAQQKAEEHNSAFAPMRMNGGRAVQKGGWAAKASAGQKGQYMRQKKQEELDKQAAEVLANIAAATGKPPPAGAAAEDEESDQDADDEPHTAVVPATGSSTASKGAEPKGKGSPDLDQNSKKGSGKSSKADKGKE